MRAIQLAAGEEAQRRQRMGDGGYFRERPPAFDADQRLRCARRAKHAARIERLADERGEPLARPGCPRQHDEQARIGLSPHALSTPGGDAFGLLAPINAHEEMGVCIRRRRAGRSGGAACRHEGCQSRRHRVKPTQRKRSILLRISCPDARQ